MHRYWRIIGIFDNPIYYKMFPPPPRNNIQVKLYLRMILQAAFALSLC